MKTLWIFLYTPNMSNIDCVIKYTDKEDGVLFIQNGVYASKLNIKLECPVYYLKEDLLSRGLDINEKNVVDYAGMVDLIFNYERVVTF